MEPEQINPTPVVPQPKVNHKIFYILIFIFIALAGSLSFWRYPSEILNFFGVKTPQLCIPDCGAVSHLVDETYNWKTYRNEEYGFEFKYPSDWKIDDEDIDPSHIISISPSDAVNIVRNGQDLGPDGAISVYVYDDQGLDINKFVEDFLDLYFISKKDVVVDGINSVEAINGSEYGFSQDNVYIPHNKKVFIVGGGIEGRKPDVFNKIISTFKFIDKNSQVLYPGLNLEKVTTKNNTYGIYIDNYDFEKDSSKAKSQIFDIPVKVWRATTTEQKYDEFSNYYENVFGKNGWVENRLKVPEKLYTIIPIQADGVLGSSWGYVKISNNKLKLIGLSYQLTKYVSKSNTDEPLQTECPCEYEYRVFISDEVDISSLNLN